ncbi:MAG: hypothetical protein AMJ81_09340, partial [Phycisphaerae bacterium SM23_33]
FRIAAPKGTGSRRGPFYRLDPKSVRTDSVLRVFSGESAIVTNLIRFFAFTPADVHTQPVKSSVDAKPPIVLAQFSDPDSSPAVAARPYGRGIVLMFYTTASARWHDWPTDPSGSFVVVMNDTRNYLTRPRDEGLAAGVGEPIVFEMMDKLPANASEAQRRRMLTASARLKFPKSPNTVALEPRHRFENIASRVRQVIESIRKAELQPPRKLDEMLQLAESQFARRDLPAVGQSLKVLAGELEEWQKSADAKQAPGVFAAANSLRISLLEAARSDLAALARRELRYARPTDAGIYHLTLLDAREGPIEEVLFARNPDPAEGDLHISTREEIAAAIGTDQFRYTQPLVAEKRAASIELGAKREYWIWALIAMLVILALEIVLGQRFGHYTAPETPRR